MTTRIAEITATQTVLTGVRAAGPFDLESTQTVRWVGEVHVRRDGQDDEVTSCRHYLPGIGAIASFPHVTEAEAIACARLVVAALGVEVRDDKS